LHGYRSLSTILRASGKRIGKSVPVEPGRTPGLFGLAAMEREMEEALGRTVDLRTYHDLSRYFRDDVVARARVVYAA